MWLPFALGLNSDVSSLGFANLSRFFETLSNIFRLFLDRCRAVVGQILLHLSGVVVDNQMLVTTVKFHSHDLIVSVMSPLLVWWECCPFILK